MIEGAMKYRSFGHTGWDVSEVGFGAWEIGGEFGQVDEAESLAALHAALDQGINFFDTADVYGPIGDPRSEKLLGRLRRERREPFYVATKVGRRLNPHTAAGYNRKNLGAFVDESLVNLGTEQIDLLQLHCPPYEVYYQPETFEALDDLARVGKIRAYGVSVQKVEEGLKAIEFPNVQSVQIIFNMFRQRPQELFFREAQRRRVAVIARVPLASGLLTGKFGPATAFEPDDHRVVNRNGEFFDRGETFSGVDYQTGLEAVEELRRLKPAGMTMAQFALRWILDFEAVGCTIPGAKRPSQVSDNAAAAALPGLSRELHDQIREVYVRRIRSAVHNLW